MSDLGTGGSLAANLGLSVVCVALTHDGVMNATLAGGIQGQITRINADGTTDTFGGGAAAKSVNATITTANDGKRHAPGPRLGGAGPRGARLRLVLGIAAGAEVLGAITAIASTTIAAVGDRHADRGLARDARTTRPTRSPSTA